MEIKEKGYMSILAYIVISKTLSYRIYYGLKVKK